MLLAAVAIYGVGASPAFSYGDLQVSGADLTDQARIEATLQDVRGQNLFLLHTAPLEAALAGLSTVADATVDVRLPGTLAVTVREREPLLIWQIGARRYLADADGVLFVLLPDDPPASTKKLPVIEDRRASSVGLSVGQRLSPVDLDAATRLASLRAADVGSTASNLGVLVTDENGFVLRARPSGWQAVFGFYTPTIRTTALIPGQVRLLRSLLAGREATVERVVLASETDGTYVPRATTKPTPKPSVTPSPKPSTRATPKPTPRRTPRPTAKPSPAASADNAGAAGSASAESSRAP
jgi:hypothetical protein